MNPDYAMQEFLEKQRRMYQRPWAIRFVLLRLARIDWVLLGLLLASATVATLAAVGAISIFARTF